MINYDKINMKIVKFIINKIYFNSKLFYNDLFNDFLHLLKFLHNN